ncbi:TetR/AcrR family transcriptional regulator [Frankia sp. CNm7]|uniref:TetR/AcrR family transcriptional regulator n=1 Tax=Frankia nepalensis TaxID=1836974 RepID=A0A937RK37_9ACTN|nr:TetR/AcrR family transcriptional regulator [Frankia nepalensis]MBL7500297.1 TetR/AcrR family transcriptional regulator [Frankia nepalensis]MBL7511998.1 TetR/AcrR family transcriptional regulator [Frankia nepalensis]MBL7521191.1 TetR/AcrR family transcriptional regulator [Frankia nepalensis]MBL7631760.1 TetR/AcrR family transcriptional regulator [Frankia nepalensis]
MSPRPRTPEDIVLRATIDVVAELGLSAVTVEAVAERSGVSRPTIYRHWGSRENLIHAAFTRIQRALSEADTGSVREDLIAMLSQLVTYLNRILVFPSLMEAAVRDPKLAALREETERESRIIYERVIRRGINRGELPDGIDVQLFIDLVIAPFVYRRVNSQQKISPASVPPVVDAVLAAFSRIPA